MERKEMDGDRERARKRRGEGEIGRNGEREGRGERRYRDRKG